MRTFIAVDLPQEVKAALAHAQGQLSASTAKLSLARDFHLTLKFLGEISPARAEIVRSCLNNVHFKEFSAAVSGVGVFPSESRVRVVWAGIEPENKIIQLQRQIDAAVEKEFPRDKDFRPHVTLARVRFVPDKTQFSKQLQQLEVEKVSFGIDSFSLRKSTLSRDGAVYEDLAVFPSKN